MADFLLWVIHIKGACWLLHYLDDFIVLGSASSDECLQFFLLAHARCKELGREAHKVGAPTTCLTFLGIEIDSVNSQLRLPNDKLRSLKGEISSLGSCRACTKKQLLSLIGQLSHACKVVKPGRSFLRRLIDLSTTASQLHHDIRLNISARANIR